ncbi:MAG TPA: GNAT family N-acetyltransferase [Gemmatimonadaceae bacterium]
MFIYTFLVHNFPSTSQAALDLRRSESTSPQTLARRAIRADAGQILELVTPYAAQGLMLPRTFDQIAARIDNYVVAMEAPGRVVACAALEEYSPSLAEVSSVAVAPAHQGKGLGSQVVLGVERLARARDIEELFALSLTDEFFLSLSYRPTTISRYPEKLARYDTLSRSGVEIVPRRCFHKVLGRAWQAPRLVARISA